jgi:hypothetical protein
MDMRVAFESIQEGGSSWIDRASEVAGRVAPALEHAASILECGIRFPNIEMP